MKLAKLVVPVRDNEGRLLDLVHHSLRVDAIEKWGGFTAHNALGGWRRPDGLTLNEPVMVYEIAMSMADVVNFRSFVRDVAREARQDCVMMVTPNGDVEFVKPSGAVS